MTDLAKLEQYVRSDVGDMYGQVGSDPDDYMAEIADQHVPVYYVDLIALAAEHLDFATDEPEVWAFDGSQTPINGIAGNIYQHLRDIAQAEYDTLYDNDHKEGQ